MIRFTCHIGKCRPQMCPVRYWSRNRAASYEVFIVGAFLFCSGFSSIVQVSAQLDNESQADISTLPKLFDNVKDSVVSIYTENATHLGSGSGFIYDSNGHVVTNNHVINGFPIIDVTFLDGNAYSAKVVGADPYSDLAVLQLDESASSKQLFEPIPLINSSNLQVGQQVVAIGNPGGSWDGSMTYGIVSQIGRSIAEEGLPFKIPNVIQIDAAINPGNSGGPLFNFAGQLMGVNTASSGVGLGINFAVPSNTVQKVVPELITNGNYKHPWFGIYGENITPRDQRELGLEDAKGVKVLEVTPRTPAQKAGVMPGDVIVGIDDKEVRRIEDLLSHIEDKSVGQDIEVQLMRDGTNQRISAVLTERPSEFTIRGAS